ncbi:MAG: insulinase family protein [Deltaproteobacteria bacterium]|nr:insulinase family protein [Deltaproteobacteria bacterium]
MRKSLLLMLALCSLPRPAVANEQKSSQKIDVQIWRLANGLQVAFVRQSRVPVVTVQVWYGVGSKDERRGIRGSAHMFEHMMFKGSKRVRPEAHARMISSVGGSCNAFTTEDVTAYHNTVPKQYLDFALKLEAERMRSLVLTDKWIDKERQVVKEEKRKRLDNSPIGRALEALTALTFEKHPYAWTPAGFLEELNRMKRSDFRAFYDRYYQPNNATVVVVGDVERPAVEAAVNEYFSKIPKAPDPPRVAVKEPEQRAYREKVGDWPSQLSVFIGAYHIPAANHPDIPALEMLSTILSAGRTSRLYQALVRKKQIAVAAGGFVWPREQPGVLIIYGIGLPRHDVAKIKAELLTELERVADEGVASTELLRAQNQLATSHLRRLRTVYGIANAIGMSTYVQGNPRAFLEDERRFDAVTQSDIKRVAQRYLRRSNLSAIVLPASSGKAAKGGRR